MVINIISNQIKKTATRGPKKVLVNLIKGLDIIGVDYVFNQPINNYKYNWIQDSISALVEVSFLNIPTLLGPNISVKPKDLPYLRHKVNKNSIYLQPSKWSKSVWLAEGFNECKVEEWPVGIDTDLFYYIDRFNLTPKILVYFKQRKNQELDACINLLNKCGIDFCILKYGDYSEDQFMVNLKECTFCIWIGCDESQGIAMQEALSTNMPIIVIKDTSSQYNSYDSSSAPYFDNTCGVLLENISLLSEHLINSFNPRKYNPRKYIINNLSLEVCAKIFLEKIKILNVYKLRKFNLKYLGVLVHWIELPFRKSTFKILFSKIRI